MDSNTNVLIVDDRSTNVLLLTELLKNLDINIVSSTSAEEALELVRDMELALALLDVQMPIMNGHELAVCLNENRSEHVPIIFVTATYPENDQIIKGYEAGAVDYIVKPFKSEILLSKVKVFIKLYQQKKELSEIASKLITTTKSLYVANKSLQVSEEEYRTLLNAAPDGILLINQNGVITDISRSTLNLYGSEKKQHILGKHYLRFVPQGQSFKIKRIMEYLEKEGLAQNIEFTLMRKDSTCYPSEISVARIERKHGSSLSYMLLIRDISKRKSIESQLIHSERLASLGEMASGMAHEINQPLNTISLVLDNMILEASGTEHLSKAYFEKKSRKIFESIQRIKNIIDHVRIFSRSNTDFINEPFDVNQSIRNALSLMNEQLRQRGIDLRTELTDPMPSYTGNTFELEQVFINLLSNARDALMDKTAKMNSEYGKIIEIHTYHDSNNIFIDLKDNGIGIRNEVKDRIFLPFFSTKDPGKGTGLGLSISYTIIKNMNGNIWFESEEMKGSMFQIIFPLNKKQEK